MTGAALRPMVLAVIFTVACGEPPAPPPPSDFILITVDTLRQDHMSVYGYPRRTTPRLEELARECMVYDRAYAHAASTGPALASLMTGLYPHDVAVLWNGHRLQPEVRTIAEALQGSRRTMAVVSNVILVRDSGFDQGFDVYDDRFNTRERNRPIAERSAEDAVRAAIGHFRAAGRTPVFLWVHCNDPHGPYTPVEAPFHDPPPGFAGPEGLPFGDDESGASAIPRYQALAGRADPRDYVNLYDAEILATDAAIGALLDELRRDAARWDRALVVVTADHGEALGEHDRWFVHGHAVWEEIVHVPLLIKLPRGYGDPRVREDVVGHAGIFPSLSAHLGISLPEPRRSERIDLQLEGSTHDVFAIADRDDSSRPNICLIDGPFKLFRFLDSPPVLYDLSEGEREDVAPRHASRVEGMSRRLSAIHDGPALALEPHVRKLDEEQLRELRELGYLSSAP